MSTPTNEEYDAAIGRLIAMYADDSEPFVSLLETVRDEEQFHDGHHEEFVDACMGCFTERLADAITRAAMGDTNSKRTPERPELCNKEGRS